ncbi:MAG: molybdopterin oxidoreductase family protein [Betaproteobacteria bacterium]|nr:molybdopterin oxidoreductase family protein [Betaproteobacteria bacterium]
MNAPAAPPELRYSVCPHDCPSTCALEIERLDARTIGRVRGAGDNSYTAGVVCAKVARYAERANHPDRLRQPLRRKGPKGSGRFEPLSWDDALELTAEGLLAAERRHGPQAVWPYYYAGTMGLVMRDGIHRLRNVKRYSGQYSTICVTPAWTGYIAGTGKLAGADPREMARSDCVVIWGTNPAHTQVNVMTHAVRARKERGAKIVHVDVYRNATSEAADMAIILRPGTDGAFACAVMHVLFRDGMADRDYLERYTDAPRELEAHLAAKTPQWAARITGLPVPEIEAFARLVGRTPKTYFRLGYGFSRNRNGAVNMHAALCIAAVTGAWRHEGGGAFHNNGAIYHWNKTMIEGLDALDPAVRVLDQSRIGAVLTGDAGALKGGPPVEALLVQNTNPMMVAPDLNAVHRGFARDDLFVCVHEQFMTETAKMADVVLPATMFTEHDDLYQGGGHQHIMLGPRVVDAPEGCRSNHEVICALAKRLGATHPGFDMSVRELIDWTLVNSGWRGIAELEREKWFDVQPAFEAAHYLNGFAWPDGKFRFKADWAGVRPQGFGPAEGLPTLPDHHEAIEKPTAELPFRLATSPARNFLNSSFTETRSSVKREGRPTVLVHPSDAARAGVTEGARVRLGNPRGTVLVHARLFDGLREGVLVVEGIWPNASFEEGIGINALTGADPIGPVGGAAFHDNRVWMQAA